MSENLNSRDDQGPRPLTRGPYPTPTEQVAYYRLVFNKVQIPDDRLEFTIPCPFKPHSDRFWVRLRTARWHCEGGCGEGDIFELQMRLSFRRHFTESKGEVWFIIDEGLKPPTEPKDTDDVPQERFGRTSIERRETRMLLGHVHRHPGRTRRQLQQVAHVPAVRFNRILDLLERINLVSWQDTRSTAGRIQRTYFPVRHGTASRQP